MNNMNLIGSSLMIFDLDSHLNPLSFKNKNILNKFENENNKKKFEDMKKIGILRRLGIGIGNNKPNENNIQLPPIK